MIRFNRNTDNGTSKEVHIIHTHTYICLHTCPHTEMSTIDTDTQDKSYSKPKPQRRLQVMCKEFLLFLFLWLAPSARSQNTQRDRPLKASLSSINVIRPESERKTNRESDMVPILFTILELPVTQDCSLLTTPCACVCLFLALGIWGIRKKCIFLKR